MPTHLPSTPLAEILADRIRATGPIPFAEYMEACLYHPELGYYAKSNQKVQKDYITNVDVSPVFARLLALQFHEMWEQMGRPFRFCLVEGGAGDGSLARQILDYLEEARGYFYAALDYIAVERSPARRALQRIMLETHRKRKKFTSASEMPESIPFGVVFSNELLDAMPVHRVVQEKDMLRELYVALGRNGFCEERGPLSTSAISDYFKLQKIELRRSQQAEAGLAARDWLVEAGGRLEEGFVVTVDYGREARELYDERHMLGTLMAYDRHRASEEFYRAPGEQDLTAHVNFTALSLYGSLAGLARTGLVTQTNFLISMARHEGLQRFASEAQSEADELRARLLFKKLIYPEGMGETFQVLVQHKGIEAPHLAGFKPL
jgi:SAM-dependent MidA family methyltransferase